MTTYGRGEEPQSTRVAYFYNESIIYSPNSARIVTPPLELGEYDYRFNKQDADYANFTKPQWWTQAYGWTAFTPLTPKYDGPFQCLNHTDVERVINTEGRVMGYALPEHRAQSWLDVEHNIYRLVASLKRHFRGTLRPSLPPMPTHYLKPTKVHPFKGMAHHHAKRCRDWVAMWIAYLKFMLAHVMDGEKDETNQGSNTIINLEITGPGTRKPWFILAMEDGVPQMFIHELRTTHMIRNSRTIDYAGVFVNMSIPFPSFPTILWLLKQNVPIWYYWNTEDRPASGTHAIPEMLIPSREIIDHPHATVDEEDPYGLHKFDNMDAAIEIVRARAENIESKPWEAFFNHRAAMEPVRVEREHAQAKERRLDRERHPPIQKGNFWYWGFTADSMTKLQRIKLHSYDDPELHKRPPYQMRYYAWDDEWDVCSYFEPEGDEDYTFQSDEGPTHTIMAEELIEDVDPREPPAAEQIAMHRAYFDKFSRTNDDKVIVGDQVNRASDVSLKIEATDINWYISMYHGFVKPEDMRPWRGKPSSKDWRDTMASIGRTDNTTMWHVKEGTEGAVQEFVQRLSQGKTPPSGMYDLSQQRDINIPPFDIRGKILQLKKDIYAVRNSCFPETPFDSWFVTVNEAIHAIYVYRLLKKPGYIGSREELVQALVMDGIKFQTMEEIDMSQERICTLQDITTIIPIQLSKHVYRKHDYTNYIHNRARMLTSARGRAALMAGGIVARIAKEHLGMQVAIYGPSTAVTRDRQGVTIQACNRHFADDALTEDEMDLICGLEMEYTGIGEQMAKVSWWPLSGQWMNLSANGYNMQIWTEENEQWYQERLHAIHNGHRVHGVPLNARKWRNNLKGFKRTKMVQKTSAEAAEAYLKEVFNFRH